MSRSPADRSHRDTIFLEEAEVLANHAFPGAQHVLRVHAPAIAARAAPGSFVNVRCDPALPLRRPLSIMRADPQAGWLEMLFKIVGDGTARLAEKGAGNTLSLLGPIGRPFAPRPERGRALLIGGGVGIPPMVFLAEALAAGPDPRERLVLMGSEVPFPFRPRPSRIVVPGLPEGTLACMPHLDDRGIASRLASGQGFPGCFDGLVTELARAWLETLAPAALAEIEVFGCGPTPMLRSLAALAREFDLPCQIALEEFMACGVGGCAGCTVLVHGPAGPAMKRVCVDGPVFDARTIYPARATGGQ